uniref:Clone 1378 transcribed RNA sequence n=1 Tax=Plectreurys tristis TaxID=33319 RepID=A0A0C4W5S6_PLETR|nr:PltVI [Plectreurys tristis]AJD25318.1 venom peptide U1-PLTX-Pt1a_6 [Plectreurys tristis]
MKHLILASALICALVVCTSAEEQVNVPFLPDERAVKCIGWQETCNGNLPCCNECVMCECNIMGQNCRCNHPKATNECESRRR